MNKKDLSSIIRDHTPEPSYISPLDPVITLGTAAQMLDVSVSLLRKYETEGLMLYYRTESGRRMVCREDIDRVRLIQNLNKNKGINFEGIRRLLALLPCWELKPCSPEERAKCKILEDSTKPCWINRNTICAEKKEDCRVCTVFRFGAYCTEDIKALVHGGGREIY